MSSEFPSAFSEFAPGSQIAGYRLEEQIGRGGMAVVYRAYDPRLDRHVALKILAPSLADDQAFRQRFIRESRAAAAVDHPNIIPLYEAGQADGVLFITMRFVRGPDVGRLLDEAGLLPPPRVTRIVEQVASALDAAHHHGLVHRDVKPGNVLLDATARGRYDHVYLSDFGLSKRSVPGTGLTSQGDFLGTVEYVAPEQIEGGPVDGRADQYALACTAFEMLSGAPPFGRGAQTRDIALAKLSQTAPRLSSRRAGLPAGLDTVMAKALHRAPGARFATCGEFAVALRDVFEPSAGWAYRDRPYARRGAADPARPVARAGEPSSGTPEQRSDLPQAAPAEAGPPPAPWPAYDVTPPGPGDAQSWPSAPAEPAALPLGPVSPGDPDYDLRRYLRAAAGPPPSGKAAPPETAPPETAPPEDVAPDDAAPGEAAGPGEAALDEAALLHDVVLDDVVPYEVVPYEVGPSDDVVPPGDVEPPAQLPRRYSSQPPAQPPHRYRSQPPADLFPPAPRAAAPSHETRRLQAPGDESWIAPPPRRAWRLSRSVLMSAAAAVLAAGIAAGALVATSSHGDSTVTQSGAQKGTQGGAVRQAAGATSPVALTVPACTQTAAAAGTLTASSHTSDLGGKPFGVAVTADGAYSFVSLGNSVAVLNNGHGSMAPAQVATIPAAGADVGVAITPDGKFLLAAAGSGAYVMSVPAAESGSSHAVLGSLTSPGGLNAGEITFSADGRFAFIAMQNTADIAVFDLADATAHGYGRSGFVGMVPVGNHPVGIARSGDGRYLYVVAQNGQAQHVEGRMYVIDLARAETDPAHAVVQSVTAGCEPSRILVSADGSVVWVTDRASDALVGFSAAKLLTKPGDSLIARVNVGHTPIGISFVKGGKDIMVADANLYDVRGGYSLALVSTQAALQRSPDALLGFVSVGQIPREVVTEPGGTVLVTYNESGQLQALNPANLP